MFMSFFDNDIKKNIKALITQRLVFVAQYNKLLVLQSYFINQNMKQNKKSVPQKVLCPA